MLNFTWWVNRNDAQGRNIFQGGFLGLDNIGVFDRSAPLPTGGFINQADGTRWMAMYSLNLMRIALELAKHNMGYEDIATKFFAHFLQIAEAMNNNGKESLCLWWEPAGVCGHCQKFMRGSRIVSTRTVIRRKSAIGRRNPCPVSSAATPTGAGRSGCR